MVHHQKASNNETHTLTLTHTLTHTLTRCCSALSHFQVLTVRWPFGRLAVTLSISHSIRLTIFFRKREIETYKRACIYVNRAPVIINKLLVRNLRYAFCWFFAFFFHRLHHLTSSHHITYSCSNNSLVTLTLYHSESVVYCLSILWWCTVPHCYLPHKRSRTDDWDVSLAWHALPLQISMSKLAIACDFWI